MKYRVFLIVCLFSESVSAQVIDFFASDPVWRINSSCSAPYPCVRDDQVAYLLTGDTLLDDGILWKKLHRQGLSTYTLFTEPPFPQACSGSFSFSEDVGFIRQDSLRMFFRTSNADSQQLLYDFNLEVGDTIPLSKINFQDNLVIDSVDSVWVLNAWRKRMLFYQGASWLIEGLGHNGGFLESIPPMLECGHSFICFSLNGVTAFNSSKDLCDITVSLPELPQKPISIYPNPAVSVLHINGLHTDDFPLVYSITGQQIQLNKHLQVNQWIIDVDELSVGMYLLRSNHSASFSKIFIKQ